MAPPAALPGSAPGHLLPPSEAHTEPLGAPPWAWTAEVGAAVTEAGLQAVHRARAENIMSWIFL